MCVVRVMAQVVTPQQIENRLVALSREVDTAHSELKEAELAFQTATADYEIGLAKARLSAPTMHGAKMTVQERADIALLECQHLYRNQQIAEAIVKAARANVKRVDTQVDIARSIGTSVRSALTI